MGWLNEKEKKLLEAFSKVDVTKDRYLSDFLVVCNAIIERDYSNRNFVLSKTAKVKRFCQSEVAKTTEKSEAIRLSDAYFDILKMEAVNRQLDSYLLFLEKDRNPKEKFYQPKRQQFLENGFIQGYQAIVDDLLDILCISMPPSTGKAQPLYSKVLTPSGFVEMGSIKVGDKVISGTGNVCKVLGVYPQGKRPIYELTFEDGSKCRCSDNHLWKVQTRDDRSKKRHGENGKYRVIELSSMLNNIHVEKRRNNYSIDRVGVIDFKEKDFVISPYIMGAYLGDGTTRTGNPSISSKDADILDRINSELPYGYKLKKKNGDNCDYQFHGHEGNNCKAGSKISNALKALGLWHKGSADKFIPELYLYASYEQRWDLLQGLLDTDGHTSRGNYIGFTTISKQLAEDVKTLVNSLGGYAKISIKTNCGYRNADGDFVKCKDAYTVNIQFSSVVSKKAFYLPRKRDAYNPKRNVLKKYIADIEYIGEEECQCIYIDDESHLYITDDYIITHNTTLEKFFNSAVIGWFPDKYNLFFSHSSEITRMYYDGVLNIVSDTEYAWKEIFPKLKISQTNAKSQKFNVGKYKAYPSVQCASIGAEMAGKVRCNGIAFCDDLIGRQEEALNEAYLQKLWENTYATDVSQRMEDGCKEVHTATRWANRDVIGRLIELNEGNPRFRWINVPDIDPKTGKSNFMYAVKGFSVEHFNKQAKKMDEATYNALYKGEPMDRTGALYTEEELRRYSSLPDREPDAIIGICDTKEKGIDYTFLPVCYQYDMDFYCVDCICDDNQDYGVQYKQMVDIILEHNMQQLEVEANVGGNRIAHEVNERVEAAGGRCNITTKYTESNKETKIIINADWVKKHVLFKDKENYPYDSHYGRMMRFLLKYTTKGKNKNDDVPDGWANFALFVNNKVTRRPTRIMRSPI